MRVTRRVPVTGPTSRPTDPIGSREGILFLLKEAARVDATEIHIKTPGPLTVRIGGVLTPFPPRQIGVSDARDAALALAELAGREGGLQAGAELEFSFGIAGVGRFHACLYHQRGSLASVVRRVSLTPPTLALLGAPDTLLDAVTPGRIVALVGPQRLDWLHAMINDWNQEREGYVVVLERPLRYLHRDANSSIAQREVGQDVRDLATGIRLAVRLEADLIVCADLVDTEGIEAVLSAAERGRRVLVAVECTRVEGVVDSLAQRFGSASRDDVARRLTSVLDPVLCARG